MHRLILELNDHNLQVDHIDHDPSNNTRANLRIVTSRQNMMNKKPYKNSSSKFKGIYWQKAAKKWHAQIVINGRVKYLGLFTSELEAALAYNEAAKKHYKEFAFLNKISMEVKP